MLARSIEARSRVIPGSKLDGVIEIDKRFYTRPSRVKESRVRISIYRKNSMSVELSPDEAIEFFKAGLEYSEALKKEQQQ